MTKEDGSIDVILFGGEKYTEPIVAEGTFVINTQTEIAGAYKDFHAGKYGRIIYKENPEGSRQEMAQA